MAENPLLDLSFRVTAIGERGHDVPIVKGTVPTIRFRDTTFQAETGCNRLRGTYEVGPQGQLVAGEIMQTMMKCGPAKTDQQRRIHRVLASQPTIQLEGTSLYLRTQTSALHGIAL